MPRPATSEPIDVVDEANRPIGRIPRGEVLDAKANFRTVHVFVFSPEGQFLLQQLSASRERHRLAWGSSVAAYLHAGESYEHAAQRRLREELDLTTRLDWVGATEMTDKNSKKFVGLFTTVADRARIAEPDHIAALRFLSLDVVEADMADRPHDFTPTLRHLLRFYRRRQ